MASGTCLRRSCTVCPEVLCSGRVNFPSLLLRPHVPVPKPLPSFAFTLAAESLQLGPSAAGLRDLPDGASAFPNAVAGRRSATFRATTSARVPISGLQPFLYVQASSFACHTDRSYRRNSVRHVAAVAFTSEHRMSCCLLTRRICQPSDSGQLNVY